MILGKAKGARSARATIICDGCGFTADVAAEYLGPEKPHVGQIFKRLNAQGWRCTSNSMKCPDCIAAGKTKKEPAPMNHKITPVTPSIATVTQIRPDPVDAGGLRQPSREQRRAILDLLGVCYDTDAERYKGGETDKTIADAIGDGVLPGWVAEIREEFFGPDGGNDDMEKAMAAFVDARTTFRSLLNRLEGVEKEAGMIRTDMLAQKERMDSAIARLEAIRKAVGPKAGVK